MGKGCRYRPVNQQQWDESYERIFGKEKHARNCSQETQEKSVTNLSERKISGERFDSSEGGEKTEA